MKVIIAEKPKAAGKIAYALNAKRRREGKVTVYVKEDIVIVPAVGHVFVLAEKEKTYKYPVFDVEWKPVFEVNKKAWYAKPYFAVLKKHLSKAESVVVACDYDVEGTLIGFNIARFLGGFSEEEIERMKFSTLTARELSKAFESRGTFDVGNAYAGEVRHTLDWYYGINLSRALMNALRSADEKRIMSIGRVQGPALALIAQREEEIEAFKPETYFQLSIVVKGFPFFYVGNPIKKEEEAKKLKEKVKGIAKLKEMDVKERLLPPYPPFDLTSLQIEAAKLFKFSPSKTLKLAQSLYENSYISYPRTSSQKLPPSINYRSIIEKLGKQKAYEKIAKELLAKSYLKPIEGKKEDPAHPAIHPTGIYGKMEEDEKKLYDLIVKRFLAVFSPFAKIEERKALLNAGLEFKGEGKKIVEAGWIDVYKPYFKQKMEEMPELSKEEKVDKVKLEKKKTKPPAHYTPASLVAELEKRKLGTKATRAIIIDTLFKRRYIWGKSIRITPYGKAVYETLVKYVPSILDEKLTRKLEEDMEKVASLELKKEEVIREGKEVLTKVLKEFKEHEEEIGEELAKKLRESYVRKKGK